MNNKITITIVSAIMMLLSSMSASAYDFEVNGLYFNIISLGDVGVECAGGPDTLSGNIVIPEAIVFKGRNLYVRRIAEDAFKNHYNITSVTFPNCIDSIKNRAFLYCLSLTSFNIPDSLTYLGMNAFMGCSPKQLTIPAHVKQIDLECFNSTDNLRFEYSPDLIHITGNSNWRIKELYIDRNFSYTWDPWIPDSIQKITFGPHISEWSKFYNGVNLTDVYCESSDPTKFTPEFTNKTYVSATLHVPMGSKRVYEVVDGWKNFWTIVEDVSITGINNVTTPNISVSADHGLVTISGLSANERVSVYGVNGSLLGTVNAKNGTASLQVYNEKIVIVKTAHTSKKILVR